MTLASLLDDIKNALVDRGKSAHGSHYRKDRMTDFLTGLGLLAIFFLALFSWSYA